MMLLPLRPIVFTSLRHHLKKEKNFKNWSLSSVLEAASWRSNTVFTSFYLKDVQYISEGVRSLGPFVAAGVPIA